MLCIQRMAHPVLNAVGKAGSGLEPPEGCFCLNHDLYMIAFNLLRGHLGQELPV